MKKLLLTLALAVGAMNSGFAADLYVNNSGQSGTYTTINGALAAASSGDRIFVSPMNFYPENLVITKSITIAPTTASSKISLDGTIQIQPIPGMEVTIIGFEADAINLSTVAATTSLTNTATLNIISSQFNSNSLLAAVGLKVNVHDTEFKGELRAFYCNLTKSIVRGLLRIPSINNVGAANTSDTIRVIACWLNSVEYNTHDYHLFASNNYVKTSLNMYRMPGIGISGRSTIVNCYIGTIQYLLDPTRNKDWSKLDIYNTQVSNIFAMYGGYRTHKSTGDITYYYSTTNYFSLTSYSNTTYTYDYPYNWSNSGNVNGTKTPNVLYCQTHLKDYSSFSGVNDPATSGFYPKEDLTGITSKTDLTGSIHYVLQSNPIGLTAVDDVKNPTWIDQFIGVYKDLGSPASNFTDLDLTRNDIGILGGSHSWLNYWYNDTVATGNAVIRWVDLPSEIWPGQTVNLKAEAVHTN